MKKIITLFALLFFFYQTYTAQQTPENYALRLLADLASKKAPQPSQKSQNTIENSNQEQPFSTPVFDPVEEQIPALLPLEEEEEAATQHPNTQNLLPIKLTDQITGKTSYQCPLCNKITLHKSNMVMHFVTHSEEKKFQCQLCSYAAKRCPDLDKHIRSQHPGEKYTCIILCSKTTEYTSIWFFIGVLRVYMRIKIKLSACSMAAEWAWKIFYFGMCKNVFNHITFV